jgi:cell division protein FtsZ
MGLKELKQVCDTVVVLDNNKLLEYYPNLPLETAFSVMDQMIAEAIKGLTETIIKPSFINIDFGDVRTVMGKGGIAVMFVGEARGQNRAKEVVKDCLSHPLLDINYKGARGALIHLTFDNDFTLKEAEEIVRNLMFEIDADADVVWGARVDNELEGLVKVISIMSGIKNKEFLESYSKILENYEVEMCGEVLSSLQARF